MRSRLDAVETLVGHADRDIADLKSILRAQTGLLQALRETQNSMGKVLGEQGAALGEMVTVWTRISDRLADIDRKQDEILRRLPPAE